MIRRRISSIPQVTQDVRRQVGPIPGNAPLAVRRQVGPVTYAPPPPVYGPKVFDEAGAPQVAVSGPDMTKPAVVGKPPDPNAPAVGAPTYGPATGAAPVADPTQRQVAAPPPSAWPAQQTASTPPQVTQQVGGRLGAWLASGGPQQNTAPAPTTAPAGTGAPQQPRPPRAGLGGGYQQFGGGQGFYRLR